MADFSRNELIWGKETQKLLKDKTVFVFGLGGVGGFALESLARAGVQNFTVVDFDCVSSSRLLHSLPQSDAKKQTCLKKD